MAIGNASNFKIYQEEFHGGFVEAVQQETMVFNGASQGAIQLVSNRTRGDYTKESFFKDVSGIVTRRDTTSTATVTDLALTQGEFVNVKLARRIGPIANTLDSFRKIAADPQEFSFILGQQWGKAASADYVNAALGSVGAAIASQSTALTNDITAATNKLPNHLALAATMAKMGDQSARIRAFVMHSSSFYNLIGNAIADKVYEVAGTVIYGGSPGSFNRPIIVTDSPSLIVTGTPDYYRTLALVDGAVVVEESEQRDVISEVVSGLSNLVIRLQGEYSFSVGVKGFQWDVTNGGANPLDAALFTSTNWDKVVSDNKSGPGAMLLSE